MYNPHAEDFAPQIAAQRRDELELAARRAHLVRILKRTGKRGHTASQAAPPPAKPQCPADIG
jgi:hypothetical protein